jgi:ribonuclease HI
MTAARAFVCKQCGAEFEVSADALKKYPGWTPRRCRACRDQAERKAGPSRPRPLAGGAPPEQDLTVAEVLARYTAGPKTGLFTDGAAHPNPGPGGWGVVYVVDDEIVDQLHGHEPQTTNNRMELVALIEAYRIASSSMPLEVWTDSELCVKTINEWAPGWERNGWRRKTGPIKNLELVQELYAASRAKPNLSLRWIKAHDGSRWNEYADALATAYRRARL